MRVFAALIFIVLFSTLAFASGGEGGHGGSVMPWVWKVVNFAILFFVLAKFGGKPIKDFLAKRTELLEKRLMEARQARELAEKALAEVRERLKNKDSEIEGIVAAARQSGEKEREALISEGRRMSEKAVEQAKANIDYELKRAREALKAEAAELAMELAEKKIGEKLTPELERTLFEESLAKLESGR